jgi:Cdc6-like AAA superfamily ATPase
MADVARFSEYRNYFTAALKAHSQLTVRQETEPSVDVEDLFTDNKQLPTLLSSDWHIVYGRRGTGKTTLLSFLSKDLDAQDHRASLMISMAQCLVDLPQSTSPEVRNLSKSPRREKSKSKAY